MASASDEETAQAPVSQIQLDVMEAQVSRRCKSVSNGRVAKIFPYTLDLPHSPNIYPTFHVSKLRVYSPTRVFPAREFPRPGPIISEDGSEGWTIHRGGSAVCGWAKRRHKTSRAGGDYDEYSADHDEDNAGHDEDSKGHDEDNMDRSSGAAVSNVDSISQPGFGRRIHSL
ncbi:hypothetical protein BJ138DRAFT_1182328 [Hygrophoropsis aurantiaca]|uniref:Uncharacterized protein n=1 Tax=Hygrophoropsis aurantiaca TaxID=72124 RepID=A0ACB8A4C0_9AGAM|nr:hypothetical protein BJ138DRAFT_1182328 [Hygrophoropsis aurantiaca]